MRRRSRALARPAMPEVLSQITENRKVWCHKSLIFRHMTFTFGLKNANLRQSLKSPISSTWETVPCQGHITRGTPTDHRVFPDALIGFRGLMLQAWSEKHNSFLRPLKQKGFKEERVTTIELYDIGKSHDPGIQQEPRTKMPATLAALTPCCVARHGITARRAGPVFQSHPRTGVSSPTRCHTTPPPGRSRPPWPASPASRRSTSADC
jgi:hypothetical protein